MKRWLEALNHAQRVVVSIGLAAALLTIGSGVERWCVNRGGGWFGYAPNSDAVYIDQEPILRHYGIPTLLLWLFLVGIWIVISSWLFRDRDAQPPAEP